MGDEARPVKIAVLGGGAASLTAAFELTRPELAGRYDVTVYQMGWRLGGKGASGRNRDHAQRIEEHGLHIWMGFYDNAFAVMKEAYAELARPSGPLQRWDDAFKPHDYIVLDERLDDAWHPWQLVFPPNGCTPGPGEEPTIWEITTAILRWMRQTWTRSALAVVLPHVALPDLPDHVRTSTGRAAARVEGGRPRDVGCLSTIAPPAPAPAPDASDHPVAQLLAHLHDIASSFEAAALPTIKEAIVWLVKTAMRLAWEVLQGAVANDFTAFQLWVSINLAGSAVCGILEDDIVTKGWDCIDGEDLRAWLGRHGANDVTLGSSPLRGVYDLVFAYEEGDVKRPAFAAGTAMRGMLRMLFAYKGSIFFKMQAGMGDTVFTPLYQVLARRGVKFRFFHRVDDLEVDPETMKISAIALTEQVKLAEGVAGYDPLVDVGGLPCWPSEPDYGQIANGAALRASGIDLECAWARPWQDETHRRLVLGQDFDQVVLGISIGAFPYVAPKLIANSPPFAKMVANVKTVQTCAFQLWLAPDCEALGWRNPAGVTQPPVLGSFVEPLDTWADMTHLAPREAWPAGGQPGNIAYFCGVLAEVKPRPAFDDHGFPERELARLDAQVKQFLTRDVCGLWPKCDSVRWDALTPPYMRVNIDPSERYVLSVPGSTAYRLPADGSGFTNLFLAGDWTQCGINAGCVEGAVTSGMLCARAIAGASLRPIAGLEDRVEGS